MAARCGRHRRGEARGAALSKRDCFGASGPKASAAHMHGPLGGLPVMKTFSCTTRVTQLGRAVRATERQKRVPGRDAEAISSDAEAARQCERPSGSELCRATHFDVHRAFCGQLAAATKEALLRLRGSGRSREDGGGAAIPWGRWPAWRQGEGATSRKRGRGKQRQHAL